MSLRKTRSNPSTLLLAPISLLIVSKELQMMLKIMQSKPDTLSLSIKIFGLKNMPKYLGPGGETLPALVNKHCLKQNLHPNLDWGFIIQAVYLEAFLGR